MPTTTVRGTQITNATIQRQDLDTSTVGQAVVAKIVQGSGITLSSTGGDSGTGDVTITSPDVVSTDAGNIATLGTDNHILVPQSQIWSVRLRSYNALQNSAFEVDQVNVGNTIPITVGTKVIDRWFTTKGGTMAISAGQNNAAAGDVCIPGTSFRLTRNFFRVTLTTQQSSLGTSDNIQIYGYPEGPRFRELQYDVHSLSLLVRSSVAGLVFAVSLRDPPTPTQSLIKLCTITSSGVWQLIQLPNLPVWPSSGNFSTAPGVNGYQIGINLAVGSNFIAPANAWQSGTFLGASGMSNFAASPVSSTFDIAYACHQPGAFCETPIDCPFQQAYDEALRYYCKSYDYDVALGTAAGNSPLSLMQTSTTAFVGPIRFPKAMAKIPTLTAYSGSTGAINTIRLTGGIDYSVTAFNSPGKGGFFGINTATLPAVTLGATGYVHYAADTGW